MSRLIAFACWLAIVSSAANFFHSEMERALKQLAGSPAVVEGSSLTELPDNTGPSAEIKSSETDH